MNKRTAMLEWLTVAVLLLGCALVCAGVIVIVFDSLVAAVLMIAGAVLIVIAGIAWTLVIKAAGRRNRATANT